MIQKIKILIISIFTIIGLYLILFSTKIGLDMTGESLLNMTIDGDTYLKILESNLIIPKIIGILLIIPMIFYIIKETTK